MARITLNISGTCWIGQDVEANLDLRERERDVLIYKYASFKHPIPHKQSEDFHGKLYHG